MEGGREKISKANAASEDRRSSKVAVIQFVTYVQSEGKGISKGHVLLTFWESFVRAGANGATARAGGGGARLRTSSGGGGRGGGWNEGVKKGER